MCIDIV